MKALILAIASLLFALVADSAMADPGTVLKLTIRPVRTGDGRVAALEVREEIDAGLPTDGRFSVSAPLSLFGARVLAKRVEELAISDAAGDVALAVIDGVLNADEDTPYRHWRATRPVQAPITVTYRMPVQDPAENGPPIGMKASGGGVAGSGLGFLVLPDGLASSATYLHWDLSDLAPGAIGVATSGEGDTLIPGPPSAVRSEWLLAGPAQVFISRRTQGFRAYALGIPPYDTNAMFEWADRAYASLVHTLPHLGSPPYRLMFRALDIPSFSTGTARREGGGSLLTVGNNFLAGQDLEDVHNTVFHEMSHQWVGDFASDAPWFMEGLTTYFAAVLPCRAGLTKIEACATGINGSAADYYRSKARNWSLENIAAVTDDESVRRVPYGRGLLYFAKLDSQLRAASRGRHGLEQLLQAVFDARQHGARLDDTTWETMLRRWAGRSAVTEFRASVIKGTTTLVPPSGAFGPCLRRLAVTWRDGEREMKGYQWRPTPCSAMRQAR
jgi:hypothetical protein